MLNKLFIPSLINIKMKNNLTTLSNYNIVVVKNNQFVIKNTYILQKIKVKFIYTKKSKNLLLFIMTDMTLFYVRGTPTF